MIKQKFKDIYNKNISAEEKLKYIHNNIYFDGNIKTTPDNNKQQENNGKTTKTIN
jgi:formyltetrahydrofolate synthetase